MIKDLLVDHPYYCSDSNYYSNEASSKWESVADYLDEFEGADIDMNMVFRWDIRQDINPETDELLGGYTAEIFMMHQRKGIFHPHFIANVEESDIERLKAYLEEHWKYLQDIWFPICDKREAK